MISRCGGKKHVHFLSQIVKIMGSNAIKWGLRPLTFFECNNFFEYTDLSVIMFLNYFVGNYILKINHEVYIN